MRRLVEDGVRRHVYPGATWAVGDAQGILDLGAAGTLSLQRCAARTRPATRYDVASLTKILATWTAVGALWDRGRIDLEAPLGGYWPRAAGYPVGNLTARELLSHTAGLPLRAQLKHRYGTDPAAVRSGILTEAVRRPPGEAVEYTDRAAMILGFLTEDLTGRRLDAQAGPLWRALGLTATGYGPLSPAARAGCAPTELDPETGLRPRGSVHDYSARILGASCGSAGVFSHAPDLGRFLRHLLAGGTDGAHPGVSPAWTRLSLQVHTGGLTPARGLLWHPAPGTSPERDDVWAHYGFTGTGIWLSPRLGRWAVLLTNKIYYSRERRPLTEIRDAFRELVFC
ncbi:serine hydrolase domain-containing protein [Streptomyces boncukensis]|uniref:Beta-lactamase family protein n=1 Tax=Streptomyces boncukensis TaxID=2711219 RepID=A0A6G4X7I6_9ACTN|nr:beta-lactamase family protein [Streptomyces boncukensis]